MKKRKIINSVAALSLLIGIGSNCSDTFANEVQEFSLDTMVVTATRTERTLLNTPANVTVISQQDLKQGGYQSVFEAVKNLSLANNHTYQEDGGGLWRNDVKNSCTWLR